MLTDIHWYLINNRQLKHDTNILVKNMTFWYIYKYLSYFTIFNFFFLNKKYVYVFVLETILKLSQHRKINFKIRIIEKKKLLF